MEPYQSNKTGIREIILASVGPKYIYQCNIFLFLIYKNTYSTVNINDFYYYLNWTKVRLNRTIYSICFSAITTALSSRNSVEEAKKAQSKMVIYVHNISNLAHEIISYTINTGLLEQEVLICYNKIHIDI